MSRSDLESLFLKNLPTIDRILSAIGRVNFMQPADCEDFAGWAKLRFVEDDYAILAKFRGESTIGTYLNVVLSMLYREYRVIERGRWRTSAEAKRHGKLGERLETLIVRDGITFSEATEMLRSAGLTTFSDRRLAAIVAAFPRRSPLRPVAAGAFVPDAPDHSLADDLVREEESSTLMTAATEALTRVMNTLPDEDKLIVRLLCQDGRKICDVARGLALPEKPLYRRIERLKKKLSELLVNAGVSREFVRDLTLDPE